MTMQSGDSDATAQLRAIALEIQACSACRLSQGRTNAVPGEGAVEADVMFIGEGPGYYEDQQGRPFVGAAGKLLDELLSSVGWQRRDVYITNTVKCRPPNNRDPLEDEMDACEERYLRRQIALVKPALLVTLGRISLTRLFPQQTISRAHGNLLYKDSQAVYPLYHPAAALRQQRLRDVIHEDFSQLPTVLDQVRRRAAGAPPDGYAAADQSGPTAEPPGEQLSLL